MEGADCRRVMTRKASPLTHVRELDFTRTQTYAQPNAPRNGGHREDP
jgi:hypothetical protein